MKYTRPLCFFDFESTGTDVKTDKILQIGMSFYSIDGVFLEEKKMLINPLIPIPAEATEVHGITDEMVKDAPVFKQLAKAIYAKIKGHIMVGYNSNRFDRPLLFNEFFNAGVIPEIDDFVFIDACNIFKIKESRDLEAALMFYCGEQLEGAHDAMNDVRATAKVFFKQVDFYEDLREKQEKELALFSNYDSEDLEHTGFIKNKSGKVVYGWGKNKNKEISSDPSYADWVINKSDFSTKIKELVKCHISQSN